MNFTKLLLYLKTILLIGIIAGFGHFVEPLIGYRAVGFIFLLGVIVTGVFGNMGAALLAAALSMTLWNFFFMHPRLTFHITQPEDVLMCITYFIIAAITGILTSRIRIFEQSLKESEILKESEKLHQTLLNSISHELRTPLTTIIGIASAMEEESTPNSLEYRHEVAQQLSRASDRLNRIVENLLDMSRLNSGVLSLNKEWHDINDLFGVITQRLEKNLKNHKLTISSPDHLPLVQVDFRLLEHAISNVLLNAVAYSPSGSAIQLSAGIRSSSLYVSVEDEGRGIPVDSQTRIFDKFYRIPGTPAGGTGLGLSIVKSIVELHRGKVEVASRSTGGTRFTLLLPIGKPPQLPIEEHHAE